MSGPGEDQAPALTPLEMAQNCVRGVQAIAELQDRDPLQAHIQGAGKAGMDSARLAGYLALVSIAESLDRIVRYWSVDQ